MAAIAADSGSEKGWSRVMSSMSFSLPTSGYVEKARKAASSTVQFSQKVLWSTTDATCCGVQPTGKAAWSAGASLLVSVVPRSKMDQETDLEGGAPATPRSSSSFAK